MTNFKTYVQLFRGVLKKYPLLPSFTVIILVSVIATIVDHALPDVSSRPISVTSIRQPEELNTAQVYFACRKAHEIIAAKLISPSSAKFPGCGPLGYFEQHFTQSYGTVMISGYVDSQNVYGATIRQGWCVILHPKNYTASVPEFTADESGVLLGPAAENICH